MGVDMYGSVLSADEWAVAPGFFGDVMIRKLSLVV
jgi:hypothetical protein